VRVAQLGEETAGNLAQKVVPGLGAGCVSGRLEAVEVHEERGNVPGDRERRVYGLLQAVEAEDTRLVLIAAQQGKALNATTLRELRSQAILNAPTLVEQTIRILKQQRNGGQ